MKIKAKYYNQDIIIIDFVSVFSNSIKVIYVDENGNIGTCYLEDDNNLVVVDNEYLPRENNSTKNNSTKEDIFAPIPMRWTTSG